MFGAGSGSRRAVAGVLAVVIATAGVAVLLTAAEAAVIRPLALGYDNDIFGDFIQAGNGSMRCPSPTDPADPNGEPIANCPGVQARTNTTSTGLNDSYYMRWVDVDGSGNTFNSSTASITIPTGARVEFARLNWAGDTSIVRDGTGAVSPLPGCSTRQFIAGAGSANLPAGTPENTSVRLTVGAGTTAAVAPQVITRDSLISVPASQPQFYAAHANVTANFAAAPTGSPQTVTVGNVWAPEGFGCFGGWSLVVVYAYDAPDPVNAPGMRTVLVYDGHVRQSSTDAATTLSVSGFRVGAPGVRVGFTGYEGDFNITGDQFAINGTPVAEPLSGTATNNFFVSNAINDLNPATANNLSVDAKVITTSLIPVGATSANLTFSTSGDTYLAQNLVLSVPIPSLDIAKTVVNPGPYRPGQLVTYRITVNSPGGTAADDVAVTDPAAPDCARSLGDLAADTPVTYTCTGPAPGDDFVNTATATGTNVFGDPMTAQASAPVVVINPAVEITKVADRASYTAGEVITFTITVSNAGDAPLTNVGVSDPNAPSCASTIPALAVGDDVTYTCTVLAPIPGDANTATVVGTDQLGGTVTDSATAPAPTLGAVSGTVFADRDSNGVLDGTDGDTGIAGVAVALVGTTAAGAPVNLATTTGPTGTYSFAAVGAGSYTVSESQPPAFDDGIDAPGTNATSAGNDTVTVVLASGANSTGTTFAEVPTTSLAGSVYVDADNNGVRAVDETGIGSVEVALSGTDDAGNPVELTTTTDPDGSYTFSTLRAGTYALTESQPAEFSDGTDTVGVSGGTLEAPDTVADIVLPARTVAFGYLFGEFVTASLSGSVVDDGGNAIPGATVTLTGPGGPVALVTGVDGEYSFGGLAPGTYTVTETQPAGYGDGPETVGSAGGDATVDDVISGIVLASGAAATGYLFAEDRGSLGGVVYADVNNNGVLDTGEVGLAGVPVDLVGQDDTGVAVSRDTVTADDGTYVFDDLVGGTYDLTETQPVSYVDGTDTVGTSGGTVTPPDSITGIVLAGGADATGYLFAEFLLSGLSGQVVDDGGNGVAGVTVTLTGPGGPVALVTGVDGGYTFSGLAPGTYTVTETQPAGYGDGPETVGSAGGDATVDDVISGIVIASAPATGYVFAEDRGSLAGVVFDDVDNDGVREFGESGIDGVTVTLTGTDAGGAAVDVSVVTTAGGIYVFDDLVGGTYTVTETQPTSYVDGTDTVGTSGGTLVPPDSITEIALAGGADATGYVFAEFVAGVLGGQVVDDGGNGVAGVTVTLTGPGGPVVQVTGVDGGYTFSGLAPGTYTVTETQPAGYGDGPETVGSASGDATVDDVISGIPVVSGTQATGYRFAEDRGSLTGGVFDDVDNDGAQETDEPGIGGVTVTLTGTAVGGAAVDVSVLTAADGTYLFADLIGGTYTVTETQPASYVDGTDTVGTSDGTLVPPDSITEIALAGGVDTTGYLFAEYRASSVTGSVVDDAGTGISGVTVTLTGPGDPAVQVTDVDGGYSFADLAPGTYTVTETQPAGYGDGPQTVGSAGGNATVNDVISAIPLVSGTQATGYRFAEDRGSLAGAVYQDLDDDGLRDPAESGIGGATVTLTGTDARGGAVATSLTTADDGTYVFASLVGGTYTVTGTQPPGFLDGTDAAGTSGGTVTAPDSVSEVALAGGTDATGYTFGELSPASLGGTVVDDGGNPLAGVTLTLTGTDDEGAPVSLTTTTSSAGTYAFATLRPGTYTVTETQPAGYGDGPDTAGSAGGDVSVDDVVSAIVLTPGLTASGYVFAENRGSLAGVVYADRNDDGVRQPDELGVGGVTVTLTGADALNRPVSRTAVSAVDGTYAFPELLAGTYALTETQPDGYADGSDAPGSAGGTAVPPDTIADIVLAGGVAADGYRFGELVGAITGTVFVDLDGDGVLDPDDARRLQGVTMVLRDGAGVEVARTVTDADGAYAFTNLVSGDYVVAELQPAGYGSSTPNVVEATLAPGTGATVDFGDQLGRIGDQVWDDLDGDGVQDPGEPGIEGVAVVLFDDTGTERGRTTSGVDGRYRFAYLPAGTYVVGLTAPAATTLTRPGVSDDDAVDSDIDWVSARSAPIVVTLADDRISQVSDVDAGLVARVVDLAISLTVDRSRAVAGEAVVFTAAVSNAGSVPVSGARATITIPAALSVGSASGDGWTCQVAKQVVTCTTDRLLLPGESAPPITVGTTAGAGQGQTEAVATVALADGTQDDDPVNDQALAAVDVAAVDVAGVKAPAEAAAPTLSHTGVEVRMLIAGGLLLLLLGGGFLLVSRRRRKATPGNHRRSP